MSQPCHFEEASGLRSESVSYDDILATADAPTTDEKISAMALDESPDNHLDVAPESLVLRIAALP